VRGLRHECTVLICNLHALQRDDLPVTSTTVTPGVVDTELGRFAPLPLQWLSWPIRKGFMRTPAQGSLSVVQASISPEVEGHGGEFLGEDFVPVEFKAAARDPVLGAELWAAWSAACGGRAGAKPGPD